MEWFEQLKRSLFRSVIQQRKAQQAPHRLLNFDQAKTFAIIYDSTLPDNDITITKFAEQLRRVGKEVQVYGYLNDKKIDHKADIQIFNRNAVNWYGVPVDEKALGFCKKSFDVLLCATVDLIAPLEYLATFSAATCRIGAYHPAHLHCFDLMIERGSNQRLDYLLQQMESTLKKIQTT
ncbi:MAG: hypothetical protein U0T84_01565 [Chitinophagales bacterium]